MVQVDRVSPGWTGLDSNCLMILCLPGADQGVGNGQECLLYPRVDRRAGNGKLRDARTPGLMSELLPSGKKVWKYERRLAGSGALIRLTLGQFPAYTMADARAWATKLNDQVEAGVDSREAKRAEEIGASMTVAKAHDLYMIAVRE